MKKNICYILILLITLVFLLVFLHKNWDKNNFNEVSLPIFKTKEDIMKTQIDDLMSTMTLEQKIAQMLIINYNGTTIDDNLNNLIENYNVGGFILFENNMKTYDETLEFIKKMQNLSKVPMIISIDEEGGSVQRLLSLSDVNVTDIPFMYDIGLKNDEKLACDIGRLMAEELRVIGVNVTYAPVLDIFDNDKNEVIGKRSFGNSPELVSKMSTNFARCLEENGIIATYKHFPGHGDTDTDSHIDLPVINKSYVELKNNELIPFQNAIKNDAKLIMIGHIALPNITGDNTPASLSPKIITDVLKKDYKYNNLVITDALNMKAITNNFSEEEKYIMAIKAGVDLLLMPENPIDAIEIIKKNISEERINESVYKIIKFKYENLLDYEYLDKSYLGSEEHHKIIDNFYKNNLE